MVGRISLAAIALLLAACASETPDDYVFTDRFMLLPVEFRTKDASVEPDDTYCFYLTTLELCVYTEGERIRVGYTNTSSSDTFAINWSEARYLDEYGRPHALQVFPPDLVIPSVIKPGQHRWNSFVPEGKRYFKKASGGGYFHVEWLVPWEEGSISEEEARQKVEQLFAAGSRVSVELPVMLPSGDAITVIAIMKLVELSDAQFWIQYGEAKYEASQRNADPSRSAVP